MRPFGLDNFWRRGGGVDMTFDNFERLLERGERVLYFPEGVPGIGKGFNRRYQLQRFKTSFVLLAARHRVPVYPVHIINAEWVHPFGYTFPPLDRLMQRVFHVPFLPLPIGILAIIFPWMWYLAFPCRMVFVIGEPIDVPGLLWLEGDHRLRQPGQRGAATRGAACPRPDAGGAERTRGDARAAALSRTDALARAEAVLGPVADDPALGMAGRLHPDRARPPPAPGPQPAARYPA